MATKEPDRKVGGQTAWRMTFIVSKKIHDRVLDLKEVFETPTDTEVFRRAIIHLHNEHFGNEEETE